MNHLKQGKTGIPTRSFSLFGSIKGYRELNMITYSLNKYDTIAVAKFRLKVINFHKRFGTKAALSAFPVSHATVYRWRKRLINSGGKLSSLVPQSTRPKRLRKPMYHKEIVMEMKRLREKRYSPGKKKLKVMLDKFCVREDITKVSISTIGRILKKKKYFYNQCCQARHSYHTATGKWARKRQWREKRKRRRYHPQPKSFGYIEMDTVVKHIDGKRYYIITVIDVKLKFAYALMYPRLNSNAAKDCLIKFLKVYPCEIGTVQTDNGLEFLGEFNQYLKKENIPHYFIYPRCPRINGVVERFNRTLQEEFVNSHLYLIHQQSLFNEKLKQYLLYYDNERPHESLTMKSPMEYLINFQ